MVLPERGSAREGGPCPAPASGCRWVWRGCCPPCPGLRFPQQGGHFLARGERCGAGRAPGVIARPSAAAEMGEGWGWGLSIHRMSGVPRLGAISVVRPFLPWLVGGDRDLVASPHTPAFFLVRPVVDAPSQAPEALCSVPQFPPGWQWGMPVPLPWTGPPKVQPSCGTPQTRGFLFQRRTCSRTRWVRPQGAGSSCALQPPAREGNWPDRGAGAGGHH